MSAHTFRLGMFLNELRLPLDEGLDLAQELAIEYVWFGGVIGRPPVAVLADDEIDAIGNSIAGRGLKLMVAAAGNPFKAIDLTTVTAGALEQHAEFARDFRAMVRSMEIANRLGADAVSVYSFAWPGEYTAGKPTWPMRWLTRGGIISDGEMEKLVQAYSLMVEQAERHRVDLVLSMMPWNYTNTTGNFRRLAERVGSARLKVMWGPADNYNCGESDACTAGFLNIKPYLHSIHLKDLRVNDGLALDFDYVPLGEGDIDYATALRNIRDAGLDPVISVATHWTPASGSRVEATRTQVDNLRRLIASL